jgi:tRNA threonylcarbamoyladenosine biosynthesis protein TsaE
MKIVAENLSDLPEVASQLLDFAGAQKFIVFNGEMGAGKTTFIKILCKALGVNDVVSSPTYSIVNEYAGKNGPVYHFDFYRIKNIQEAYDLGYEEYFYSNGICLIEWPERIEELLPDHYIQVDISIVGEEGRIFECAKT